jgi:excisionase family DNA binding protein
MVKLVTIRDASQQLGVSIATIRDWRLRRKHLDFVKIGRAVRVLQCSIDKVIEQQTLPALNQG